MKFCPTCKTTSRKTNLMRLYDVKCECKICISEVDVPVTLPCGHVFCKKCIIRWFDIDSSQSDERDESWKYVAIYVGKEMVWRSDSTAEQISLYVDSLPISSFSMMIDTPPTPYGFIAVWKPNLNPPRWSMVANRDQLRHLRMIASEALQYHMNIILGMSTTEAFEYQMRVRYTLI